MTNHDEYFTYLMQRSRLGHFYRRHILYPRLIKRLPGYMLDIGCGIGDMLEFHPNSIGVDVNEKNVEYCINRGLNALVMTPDHLPFDSESFDSVLIDNVLEHIEDPNSLLAETKRVIRPNGGLLIGVPGVLGWHSDADHKVFYNENLLVNTLTKNSFTLKKLFYTPLVRSEILSKSLRQYCIYGLFTPN